MTKCLAAYTCAVLSILVTAPCAAGAQAAAGSPAAMQRALASRPGESDKDFKPRVKHDAFTKTTTTAVDVADENGNLCSDVNNFSSVKLTLAKLDPPDSASGLSVVLLATYEGNGWIFMNAELPIRFLVADSVVSVHVFAIPTQDVVYGSDVREQAYATPTSAQLRALGSADSTTMRITGQRGTCDVRLKRKQLHIIELFDERVLGDTAR